MWSHLIRPRNPTRLTHWYGNLHAISLWIETLKKKPHKKKPQQLHQRGQRPKGNQEAQRRSLSVCSQPFKKAAVASEETKKENCKSVTLTRVEKRVLHEDLVDWTLGSAPVGQNLYSTVADSGVPVYISTDESMITPQLFIMTAPQETAALRAGLPSSCPIVRQQQALNGV